jgi:hypothetical protein
MTTHTQTTSLSPAAPIDLKAWVRIGLAAAALSIVAVLIAQALAMAVWPDIALFKPLDSYARSAVFVLVPAIGATAVFAWLVNRATQPVSKFVTISVVVLLVSIVPDYVLPVPNKTVLASSVTAFLHVVAGVITVATLVFGYQRQTHRK